MFRPPEIRLALGLGDQALEQRLRPALDAAEDMLVVAQCLAADQLVQAVESGQVDAVVVAASLHRLTNTIVDQIERMRMPLVLLVADPADPHWRARSGPVLGVDSQPDAVRQAVLAARRGERIVARPRPVAEPIRRKPVDRNDAPASAPACIIAVAGGAGSSGRTTVALNLATILGASEPTVLVELDLGGPALAAHLGLDPSRNVCTLAHAVRELPHSWSRAFEAELQPLAAGCPFGAALCGPPKHEMRSSVAPAFAERLLAELATRYRYVVVDVGAEWLGPETPAAVHRVALACAQRILLVSAPDLVGLWHARTAIDHMDRHVGVTRERLELVLNAHDARYHHGPAEVEWHLGVPVTAVIPFDHAAIERATAAQRPLVLEPTSRASRALFGLAERLHTGKLRPAYGAERRGQAVRWWQRLARQPQLGAATADPLRRVPHISVAPPATVPGSGGSAS